MDKIYAVTPAVGLNIRSGPGTSHSRVGTYPCGAAVQVLELQDDWGRTELGWVCMDYLEEVNTPDQSVTDNGIALQTYWISSGRKNRPGGINALSYITIHETGNPARGADAAAHGSYLDSAAGERALVSWHYTVDDHAIVQHLPDSETAYHAGDGAKGPGNTTSIGIELCVNAGGDFSAVQANAAALVRLLMARHGVPLDHVVQHNHWSGKDCPHTLRHTKGGWEGFLALVQGASPEITPLERAVDQLAAAGLLNSPDYWTGDTYSTENVQALLRKTAQALGR